jgi:FtsZ-binding cell division protein ZapB
MSENWQQNLDVERFFSEFGPNPRFKVTVRRAEPVWCSGYLETIDADEEEFTWETIRDRYGGGKFYLKIKDGHGRYLGHRTVKIADRPMENGRPISWEEYSKRISESRTAKRKTESACECAELREELDSYEAEVQGLHELVDALEDRVAQLEEQHKDIQETAYEALNLIENSLEADKETGLNENRFLAKRDGNIILVINNRGLEALITLGLLWFIKTETDTSPDQSPVG